MLAEPSADKVTDYEEATSFLGEWGRFQRRVFFILGLGIVFDGLTAFSIVFLADTPAHRCVLPSNLNLSAAWRNSSIPLEEDASHGGALVPSRCSRYKVEYLLNYSQRGFLPGVDVNLSNVPQEGCLDGWEFDHSVYTSTIVSEVCSTTNPFDATTNIGEHDDVPILLLNNPITTFSLSIVKNDGSFIHVNTFWLHLEKYLCTILNFNLYY